MTTGSHDWRVRAPSAVLVATIAAMSLVGCGGGGGGHHKAPATYVTGVAATGAPVANAAVTMKDAAGKVASATTAADGSFRITSTKLKPPFLVQVSALGGNLYSVSADSSATTTINVTTLTDLATRAWFTVNGSSSMDAVFQNPSGIARPGPSQVQDAEELVDDVFALWLKDAGVDAATHNLISTPFKADGTGIDKVLGQTSVNGWVITITGPAVPTAGARANAIGMAPVPAAIAERTQVTTMSFDTGDKTVTAESTVTAGTESSSSVATTVLPTSSSMETAFQDIDAQIGALAKVANDKRQALIETDVLPYLDPQGLNQGLNQYETAELFVAQLRMSTADAIGGYLISLDQLDVVNGTAHGYYTFTETKGGQTATNRQESNFRLVDGKWLMSGDGRPGYMYAKFGTMTEYDGEVPYKSNSLDVNASTREGAYVSANVSGAQWVDAPMIPDDSTGVDEAGHRFRGFYLSAPDVAIADLPAAGTPFTFKLQTPNAGPVEQYVVKMNAAANAYVYITSAPSGTAADLVGKTVTLAWTLPVTVVIDEVNLQGGAYAGSPGNEVSCDIWGDPLSTTATSGSVYIEPTCDGQAITHLYLGVNVEGVNGEEISAWKNY